MTNQELVKRAETYLAETSGREVTLYPSHPTVIVAELLAEVQSQATRIAELERERDEARALVIEANNSLYGSQGYFHSFSGGDFDKYHLANGIENLKASSRAGYRANLSVALAIEALEPFAAIEPTNIYSGDPDDTDEEAEALLTVNQFKFARSTLQKIKESGT